MEQRLPKVNIEEVPLQFMAHSANVVILIFVVESFVLTVILRPLHFTSLIHNLQSTKNLLTGDGFCSTQTIKIKEVNAFELSDWDIFNG